MANALRYVIITLLMALLAVSFWVRGSFELALWASGLGLVWLAADFRAPEGRPFLDGLGLVGFCVLAADGVSLGLPGWVGLAAVLLALAGWDLARFCHRLRQVTAPQPAPDTSEAGAAAGAPPQEPLVDAPPFDWAAAAARMERAHLARLGLALAGGLLLGGLALLVRIELTFIVALVVGIVAVYAIARVVRGLN